MFTGIIAHVGRVESAEPGAGGNGLRLAIATEFDSTRIDQGASIACNGACLTVVESGPRWFAADVSRETLAHTTLGDWRPGRRINLERALRLGDELGGHMVLGHVDGVGSLAELQEEGADRRLVVDVPAELAPFIARKGSVAVDGISLTVNSVENNRFTVNVIPYTWQHTALADLGAGDKVNIEIDMMARYAARLMECKVA